MLQPTDDDEAIIAQFLMSFLSSHKTYPIAQRLVEFTGHRHQLLLLLLWLQRTK